MPRCPNCGCSHCPALRTIEEDVLVPQGLSVVSRKATRRRRECRECKYRFTTKEADEDDWARLEAAGLSVDDAEAIKRGEMEDPTVPSPPSQVSPSPADVLIAGLNAENAPPPVVVPPLSSRSGRKRGGVAPPPQPPADNPYIPPQ